MIFAVTGSNGFLGVHIIHHLLKERGFTVEGAKKKLRENKSDTINNVEIIAHLQDVRKFLVSLKDAL